MDPTDRVRYWLDLADYDLETAQAMLETRRYLYVGFMCHQTIEKALKGFHVRVRREEAPFTHSLSRLVELSGLTEMLSEAQLDFLVGLEPMNIAARYPADKERLLAELSLDSCAQLISQTKELLQWTKQRP